MLSTSISISSSPFVDEERQREEEALLSQKERERDKMGLGGHWVPPTQLNGMEGPTRSGGVKSWSGWSAAREEDAARGHDGFL